MPNGTCSAQFVDVKQLQCGDPDAIPRECLNDWWEQSLGDEFLILVRPRALLDRQL
jgi:hypothetical protein